MRRPFRSFTVEVKRSRPRTGDPFVPGAPVEPQELPKATVTSALSWEELLKRLPENVAPQTDQPFLASWPGLDDDVQPYMHAQHQPQPDELSSVSPIAPTNVAPTEQSDAEQKPRILPSLLPVEIPLTERKSAVYSRASDPWPSPRSRLPKQVDKPRTTELRAAGVPPAALRSVSSQPASSVQFVPTDVPARVQARLRQMAVEAGGHVGAAIAGLPEDQLIRPVGKRRRQDFWKHRLRSYAARD